MLKSSSFSNNNYLTFELLSYFNIIKVYTIITSETVFLFIIIWENLAFFTYLIQSYVFICESLL